MAQFHRWKERFLEGGRKGLGELKSLVKFTENGSILNEKRINILKKLAGRFLIVTNTDLPESEVVSAYKDQWQIERSFRTIKSFIEIRPVYHRKSERSKTRIPDQFMESELAKNIIQDHMEIRKESGITDIHERSRNDG